MVPQINMMEYYQSLSVTVDINETILEEMSYGTEKEETEPESALTAKANETTLTTKPKSTTTTTTTRSMPTRPYRERFR